MTTTIRSRFFREGVEKIKEDFFSLQKLLKVQKHSTAKSVGFLALIWGLLVLGVFLGKRINATIKGVEILGIACLLAIALVAILFTLKNLKKEDGIFFVLPWCSVMLLSGTFWGCFDSFPGYYVSAIAPFYYVFIIISWYYRPNRPKAF